MNRIKSYQNQFIALATQLEKLLKVINHSDPTAEEKKRLLFSKYKINLSITANQTKSKFQLEEIHHFIRSLSLSNNFPVADDVKEIIINRLLKDFESEFITKQVLTEFIPPDSHQIMQKARINKIRKTIQKNRKQQPRTYSREMLMDMVQLKDKQRDAKRSLSKLVNVMNKINDEAMESTIKQFINEKETT